ncbi:MAG: hypothetical protein IPK77_12140 [Cellvibrio sp.]|nr:hypothetical protein [Cellvibrio sp.]
MTQQLKLSIFAVMLFLLGMIVYLNWKHVDSTVSNIQLEKIVSNQSISEVDSKIQQVSLNMNQQQSARVDEVLAWQADRGWYDTGKETQDDYKTYSEETLKQLADQGDIKALHLLARLAPLELAIQLYTKAAVYGSTFALFNIQETLLTQSGITKENSEELKHPVLIEAAAYIQVATMRGDMLNAKYISSISSLESRFNFQFSGDDLEQANLRAQDIYDSLEAERIALGLGKFDNSIPPAIKIYFKASGIEVED